MKVTNDIPCLACGKDNKELVIFDTTIFKVLPKEIVICQSCISKAFRSFTKKK